MLIEWRKDIMNNQMSSLDSIHSIILDEVHERSFEIDIITGCLKSLYLSGKLPKNL